MLFAFTVNQALYLALAREDAAPLAGALARSRRSPPTASGPTSCATTTS